MAATGTVKLRRVMRRMRERNPGKGRVTHNELKRAIMLECGIAPSTLWYVKRALVFLRWIKTTKTRVILTGRDITEDY